MSALTDHPALLRAAAQLVLGPADNEVFPLLERARDALDDLKARAKTFSTRKALCFGLLELAEVERMRLRIRAAADIFTTRANLMGPNDQRDFRAFNYAIDLSRMAGGLTAATMDAARAMLKSIEPELTKASVTPAAPAPLDRTDEGLMKRIAEGDLSGMDMDHIGDALTVRREFAKTLRAVDGVVDSIGRAGLESFLGPHEARRYEAWIADRAQPEVDVPRPVARRRSDRVQSPPAVDQQAAARRASPSFERPSSRIEIIGGDPAILRRLGLAETQDRGASDGLIDQVLAGLDEHGTAVDIPVTFEHRGLLAAGVVNVQVAGLVRALGFTGTPAPASALENLSPVRDAHSPARAAILLGDPPRHVSGEVELGPIEPMRLVRSAEDLAVLEPRTLRLPWYIRDAERAACHLPPDGLWNGPTPCGATICGIAEADRAKYEDLHFATCRHGCKCEET